MKNIIVALALFFALGASAQSTPATKAAITQTTPEEAAEKDLKDLLAVVSLDDNIKPEVQKLFVTKHREIGVHKAEFSAERKAYYINYISGRLESLIGATKFAKLKANTAVYNKLVF